MENNHPVGNLHIEDREEYEAQQYTTDKAYRTSSDEMYNTSERLASCEQNFISSSNPFRD